MNRNRAVPFIEDDVKGARYFYVADAAARAAGPRRASTCDPYHVSALMGTVPLPVYAFTPPCCFLSLPLQG